ncbi:IclR family transcriptional regulator [Ornithinimicrobium murale]|uniref:IclR family transcriptional regulator n=1 Tax=Ornithinimicrobium murale TaxID=1050153 RepID=UPI000E0D6BFE|nr:IclR family transcriptional regulator [Ornithinimicrobium murale]
MSQSAAGQDSHEREQHGVRTVKSADRTLALLEYLMSVREPMTLRSVSEDLGIPRASAYALLVTLQRRGWVDSAGSRFRLGLSALRAAASVIDLDDTVRATEGIRNELAAQLSETVHLARLDGTDVVYLQSFISPHSLSVVTRPGRRLPAWTTALGKALLADRPWAEVDQLLPKRLEGITQHSVTTRAALRRDLAEAAEAGYAQDDEENTIGLRCYAISVPLVDPPLYAISVSVPTPRVTSKNEKQIIQALRSARATLSTNWQAPQY